MTFMHLQKDDDSKKIHFSVLARRLYLIYVTVGSSWNQKNEIFEIERQPSTQLLIFDTMYVCTYVLNRRPSFSLTLSVSADADLLLGCRPLGL
jgi:hypothetical protein